MAISDWTDYQERKGRTAQSRAEPAPTRRPPPALPDATYEQLRRSRLQAPEDTGEIEVTETSVSDTFIGRLRARLSTR